MCVWLVLTPLTVQALVCVCGLMWFNWILTLGPGKPWSPSMPASPTSPCGKTHTWLTAHSSQSGKRITIQTGTSSRYSQTHCGLFIPSRSGHLSVLISNLRPSSRGHNFNMSTSTIPQNVYSHAACKAIFPLRTHGVQALLCFPELRKRAEQLVCPVFNQWSRLHKNPPTFSPKQD